MKCKNPWYHLQTELLTRCPIIPTTNCKENENPCKVYPPFVRKLNN